MEVFKVKNLLLWGAQSPTLAWRILFSLVFVALYVGLMGFSAETASYLFCGVISVSFFSQFIIADVLGTKESRPYWPVVCATVGLTSFAAMIAVALFAPISQGWVFAFVALAGTSIGASCARRAFQYWDRVDREQAAREAEANKNAKKKKKDSLRA